MKNLQSGRQATGKRAPATETTRTKQSKSVSSNIYRESIKAVKNKKGIYEIPHQERRYPWARTSRWIVFPAIVFIMGIILIITKAGDTGEVPTKRMTRITRDTLSVLEYQKEDLDPETEKQISIGEEHIRYLESFNEPYKEDARLEQQSEKSEQTEIATASSEDLKPEALEYSQEDFEMFCSVCNAEAGPSETYECIIGTMWEIRNGITMRCDGDFEEEIFWPYRYSCVEDGVIYCGDGISTMDIISEEYQEIARGVLSGEIPDPTNGATAYVAYSYWGFESGDDFAEHYGIQDYVVLGGHIFFYEEEWPFG